MELVKWSDSKLLHAGKSYTRQDKIKRFIKEYKEHNIITPLRVCYASRGGKNCAQCRKCSLTMLSLLVAGVDYEKFGFSLEKSIFVRKMRHHFFKIKYEMSKVSMHLWMDIFEDIKPNKFYQDAGFSDDVISLMDWLRSFDIEAHSKKTVSYATRKRRIIGLIRKTPFLIGTYQKFKVFKNYLIR